MTTDRFFFLPSSNTLQRKHSNKHKEHRALRWLPASSGAPLQELAGPFSSKVTGAARPSDEKGNVQFVQLINNNETFLSGGNRNSTSTGGQNTGDFKANNTNTTNAIDVQPQKSNGISPLFGQDRTKPRTSFPHGNKTAIVNPTSNKSYYRSLMATYFPFLQSTTVTNTPLRLPSYNGESISSQSLHHAKADYNNGLAILNDKSPNDTITVSDLKLILMSIQSSNPLSYDHLSTGSTDAAIVTTAPKPGKAQNIGAINGKRESSAQVAFPQPSILSYRDVQRGTTFAGGIIGMILGTTILPNLWLIGMLFGALYGFEVTRPPLEDQTTEEQSKPNPMGRYLIKVGRMLATKFLQFYDYWKTLWFLYKTGQLSYEYYKRYETLDKRFEIQSKVDAWNARFVEGKKRFDKWEQDNEIGRTVLAGLRTLWLVDEQSRRRTREKSRYRAVQLLYDAKFYARKWFQKAQYWAKSFFREGGVNNFLTELQTDLATRGSMAARFAAVLVAVAVVNIGGALFSISPGFSNCLAVLIAVASPSRALNLLLGIRIQGADSTDRSVGGASFNAPDFMRRYDRKMFYYYTRSDGTKKYYRTGQSTVASKTSKRVQRENSSIFSFNSFFQKKSSAKLGDGWLGTLRKP
ncbi:hypothetical protein IV203_029159 [Nitzschia inconspicua]|uniref:Uncharacterized protein n=1 Tax=Nitzschia inconspicua TaxID=303405 RepID=A0A9K3LRA4_9STRA|nr:hypothetical protein IV203_029159 [Nitzschia inconspicua]